MKQGVKEQAAGAGVILFFELLPPLNSKARLAGTASLFLSLIKRREVVRRKARVGGDSKGKGQAEGDRRLEKPETGRQK